MKRAAMMMAILGMTAGSLAQSDKPATQNPPAGQSQTPAAGQAAAPAAKRPPQAKTQPEFDAYKAAALLTDPVAQAKAADDFATKFPDSELRILLYKAAMHGFQTSNNGEQMLEMGRKVLALDGDDPEALIGVAEVLAERTRDTDLDRDQRLDEAMKDAQRAVVTVDTDVVAPAGTPQEKIDAYKGYVRSSAYSIVGTILYNRKDFAGAESNFHKSIDAFPQQPDPIAVLRLALALDGQGKYPEALKYANQAVDLTKENTAAGNAARHERDRLAQLTGATPAAEAKPAAPGQTPQNQPPKN